MTAADEAFRVLPQSRQPGTVPRMGDYLGTWFSGRPDGLSRVLAVTPYRGRYPQWFRFVLTLTAPATRAGSLEMTY